jgi:hypothetical protein
MVKLVLAACALLCLALPAQAHRHRPAEACVESGTVMQPRCGVATPPRGFLEGVRSIDVEMKRERVHRVSRPHTEMPDARILAHPAGCPARAFCGCGAAVRIFGRPIRSLWLVANWFRFPRAEPSAGMAAVRWHHVFVLEAPLRGQTWLVFDANSGHGLTRLHPRSLVGYVVVDPHGSRV